jgi:YD repeat-containing protein
MPLMLICSVGGAAERIKASFTEYYSTLPFRESPFADLRGIHPLTAEQAAARNHFRFEYDGLGRPIRISFRLGEVLRELNHASNFFFASSRMDIEYGQGEERRRFFDRHGNPVSVQGAYRQRFELDDMGYREALHFEDAAGQSVQNDWGIARYHWRIRPDGTVIEHREDLAGEPVAMRPNLPFYELHLHYGPGGWLALMQNFGLDGVLVDNALHAAQDKLEYEADGDMRAWNVLDRNHRPVRGNSPHVARGVGEYDRWGYDVGSRYEDEKGEPIRSAYGWGRGTVRHDRFGNMIERRTGDEHGNPGINELLGYAGYRLGWDESGLNRLSLEYFGVDGEPVVHRQRGYHVVRSSYDDRGNRIRNAYFDTAGQAVNRIDTGFASIAYRYDERNRLVETRYFDRRGAPVNHAEKGWAIERLEYNRAGEVVSREQLDQQSRPAQAP